MSSTPSPRPDGERDRGSLTIIAILLTLVCLAGGALIVDGGRAMSARRHAAGTAEASARYAVATLSLASPADDTTIRARAVAFAARAGVSADDVDVTVFDAVDGPTVVVTITEHPTTVFLTLGGASTMTIHATGSARFVYST